MKVPLEFFVALMTAQKEVGTILDSVTGMVQRRLRSAKTMTAQKEVGTILDSVLLMAEVCDANSMTAQKEVRAARLDSVLLMAEVCNANLMTAQKEVEAILDSVTGMVQRRLRSANTMAAQKKNGAILYSVMHTVQVRDLSVKPKDVLVRLQRVKVATVGRRLAWIV